MRRRWMRTPSGSDHCQNCRSVRLGGGYGWKVSHTVLSLRQLQTGRRYPNGRLALPCAKKIFTPWNLQPSAHKTTSPAAASEADEGNNLVFPHCLLNPPQWVCQEEKSSNESPKIQGTSPGLTVPSAFSLHRLFSLLSTPCADASRFGSAYLSKLGFDHADKNATLGTSGVGLTQHLKVRRTPFCTEVSHTRVVQVHHKLDMLGIGAQHTKDPNGIAWKQNRDFENLLKRLNANSEGPTDDGADSAPIDGFHPASVDEPVIDVTTVGWETEGRDEERRPEREKKNKKKKRPRGGDETAETERKPKKRKKDVGSTTAEPASEPMEVGSPRPNSPTQGIISFVATDHSHSKITPDA